MLSQAKIKWIRSLELKKNRLETGFFLAEGTKCVRDLMELLPCRFLAATPEWVETCGTPNTEEWVTTDKETLRKASLQKNPQDVLAVFRMPRPVFSPGNLKGKLSLVLDSIQDPGNLGTILRVADWFGIGDVLCSVGTVDAFNPKTVQATMGAIGRIRIHTIDLVSFLKNNDLPVYGTFLDGTVIYEAELKNEGLLIMGNEGNGISPEVAPFVTNRLYIPDYPLGKSGSESLNVSVATAIACSEFRRRIPL